MADFVDDMLPLAGPKLNWRERPDIPANRKIIDTDYNDLRLACYSLRAAVLARPKTRVVTYVATGAEGADFVVPIGTTVPSTAYEVFVGSAGSTNVPIADIPTADHTTTTFRVLTSAVLTVGDNLKFLLVGV